MPENFDTGLVWFRRDLRVHDNTALTSALQSCRAVFCVFVFDTAILEPLPRADRRVEFIRESLVELDANLRTLACKPEAGLIVLHGDAVASIVGLAQALHAQAVFAGRDYEPYAVDRDAKANAALRAVSSTFVLHKDHVVFEGQEIMTQSGTPYGVFTPYLRAWTAKLRSEPWHCTARDAPGHALAPRPAQFQRPVPSLDDIDFAPTNLQALGLRAGESGSAALLADFVQRVDQYDTARNFPSVKGPSYLGVHLRFGTVSVRQLVRLATMSEVTRSTGAATWLTELVWRDFYAQVLANFPFVASRAFRPEYDKITWEDGASAQTLFVAWSTGQTGYPLVDAAMQQLLQTGYMHNRLRMVAGSFLVKHLGIDWRWGEQFFAQHLNDFDLASNNGGWQWVSSSGCDAQPYFRIFNPVTQSEKFDAQGKFIHRYLPVLRGLQGPALHAPWHAKPVELQAAGVVLGNNYPHPVVDHATARARTLQRYGVIKKSAVPESDSAQ
ncbi:cryptochrome/photolyase family protein [Rhodoferax sp.]|jgi:deoxyribodipyrimidine photo-lyase|uniref:cryptochrome/photolyase family protein n=1 Tax=Rhodoferax sp. TaxID=50421 RepID=UPI003784715F